MHFYSLHFIQVQWNSFNNIQFQKSCSIIINSWETLCIQIPASLQITEASGSFSQGVGTLFCCRSTEVNVGSQMSEEQTGEYLRLRAAWVIYEKIRGRQTQSFYLFRQASLIREYSFFGVFLRCFNWVDVKFLIETVLPDRWGEVFRCSDPGMEPYNVLSWDPFQICPLCMGNAGPDLSNGRAHPTTWESYVKCRFLVLAAADTFRTLWFIPVHDSGDRWQLENTGLGSLQF